MEDRVDQRVTGAGQPAGCADCVSRRAFLASTAAAATLAALEACGDGTFGGPLTTTTLGSSLSIKLSDFPSLATSNVLVPVTLPQQNAFVGVMRTGPSSFVAFSRICTHEGCITQVQNNEFDCPCHGSRFRNDGTVIVGPAERPLSKLTVTLNADNTLTIS